MDEAVENSRRLGAMDPLPGSTNDAAVTELFCRDVHVTADVVPSLKRQRCRLLDWSKGFQKSSS